jgi:hypothetical protein
VIPSAAETRLHFTDQTQQAGIHFKHTNGASKEKYLPETMGSGGLFLDYNNDGHLDIYLVNSGTLSGTSQPHRHPNHANVLYRNTGDGTFVDVTAEAGLQHNYGYGMGCLAADYDNDGDPDLYLTNFGRNQLYRNNGDGTFTDVTSHAGVGDGNWSVSASFGDFDLDGHLDLYVANYLDYQLETAHACFLQGVHIYCGPHEYPGARDTLYRNNGDGTFTDVIYEAHLGKESYLYVGFGTGYFDADNDGWLDLFIANGHIIDNIEDTHDILTYRQPDQLFRNNGDGTFQEISESAGGYFQRPTVSRGTLFGDYDNDGDIDMLVTENRGPVTLLRNETTTQNNWITIKTVGMISNRDGIGTRLTMTAGGRAQTQEVNPGASYMSSHDARCYFGLGTDTTVDRLEVRWQSGVVQVFEDLPANQEHVISEFLNTPEDRLFKAVWTGDIAALHGTSIDVNLKDAVGRTPLHIAAKKGDIDVAMFLIEMGADVNVTDAKGNTPLIFIIHKTADLKMIKRLLEKGAAVNTQNHTGETALMYAAWRGHANIVRLLLENRADATLKNRQDNTALTLAQSQGHLEIVEMLKVATK